MSNDDNNKLSSGLKVPPLKIILNSHQNNAVVNVAAVADDQVSQSKSTSASEKGRINSSTENQTKNFDKYSKAKLSASKGSGTKKADNGPSRSSNEPSSPSSSDRSSSSTPSTESESFASNSTTVSGQQVKYRQNQSKDETTNLPSTSAKQTRSARHETSDKCMSGSSSTLGTTNSSFRSRFTNDGSGSEFNNKNESSGLSSASSNQRITRSSQRAAQQSNKTESGPQELVSSNEEINGVEQEKNLENIKKVKRRKCDVSESEQDTNQSSNASVLTLINLPPDHYDPPTQNSFELFRNIKKKLDLKLRGLNLVHPRTPMGFKDYLLYSGPYLLEGNKLGYGMNGFKLTEANNISSQPTNLEGKAVERIRLESKKNNISTMNNRSSQMLVTNHRHSSYEIPRMKEAHDSIEKDSPLYNLFLEQERERHRMTINHVKELERWTLAAEQEILRVYNQAALSEANQIETLSACTLLYYQENYHYSKDEEQRSQNVESVSQDNDQLSNCTEDCSSTSQHVSGQNTHSTDDPSPESSNTKKEDDTGSSASSKNAHIEVQAQKQMESNELIQTDKKDYVKKEDDANDLIEDSVKVDSNNDTEKASTEIKKMDVDSKTSDQIAKIQLDHSMSGILNSCRQDSEMSSQAFDIASDSSDKIFKETVNVDESLVEAPEEPHILTDEERKLHNKNVFLQDLQKTDDKWAKIKEEMLIRHKNESDSLHAVQMLEWEWKVKEIGACDVRVTPKIGQECVPKVEVASLNY